ncbi:MAG: surface lipoprotein assembly modifier [Pseudomonadota bacterium]
MAVNHQQKDCDEGMAFKQRVLTKGLLAALMVAALGSAHAEVDALVLQARDLLDKGQARQAFDLLEPQETPRAGDPDFDTLLGISANETQQFTRAIFALERVLSVQPENSRARAELGRALFSVGDTAASRRVLLETKRDNIPVEAAATIDQFLQAIDRTEEAARSSVKTYVEAGFGYDTNINSGPGNANVAVPAFGGLVFTLNNAGIATKDNYAMVGAGISARYVVDPRWSLIGNFSGNGRGHQNPRNNSFNSFQLDANAGASYRYEKHEFSGVVQVGQYDVGGSTAREQAGVVGEWTYRFDGFRQLSSYIQYGTLNYPSQTIRNADRTVIGTSYAHAFRDGLLVFGGAYAGTEKEKNSAFPQFGHKLLGLRTGAQQELAQNLSAFGGLSYESRRFNGQDPLFLVVRRDTQWNLNLGLNWIPGKFWRVTPQLSYTTVKSNVAISDFNRVVLSVNVRRDF